MTDTPNQPQTKPKHAGGRPPKWDSPEAMQQAIDAYFTQEGKKSVCGLALHLGFLDHHNWSGYQNKEEFRPVIACARMRIKQYYEELGQEVRQGMFPDRMLTRMLWPAVEASIGIDGEIHTVADMMAALGSEPDVDA